MRRKLLLSAVAILVLVLPIVMLTGNALAKSQDKHEESKLEHIFVIMMENHATNQIFGNTADAPYINALASKYAIATDYFGVTHPSLPNYLATISGDFQGIWDDCKAGATVKCDPEEFMSGAPYNGQLLTDQQVASASNTAHLFSDKTIVDQLEQHSLSWKAYMQSMPSVGYTGEYYPVDTVNGQSVPRKLYAQKHNPFEYFSSVTSSPARMQKIVPYTQFMTDLNSRQVPNFAWISPDQCNDMHGLSTANAVAVGLPDCAYPASGLDHSIINRGDNFIKSIVPAIMHSHAWSEKSAIVIAFDENDYGSYEGCCHSPKGVNNVTLGGGPAPFMVITSKHAHHLVDSTTPYNHYTLLATIEKLWNLGCLENACGFSDNQLMTKFF